MDGAAAAGTSGFVQLKDELADLESELKALHICEWKPTLLIDLMEITMLLSPGIPVLDRKVAEHAFVIVMAL